MYLLTHSPSPVLGLVVVMGSMELKIARLFSCSFSDFLSAQAVLSAQVVTVTVLAGSDRLAG